MADETTDEARDQQLGRDEALEQVAEIARLLAEADSLDETLQRVVDLAHEFVDGCDAATLMITHAGGISTPAASSTDARRADEAQLRTGEGPCLSAMRQHTTVVIDDITTEDRWPSWREDVSGLGWRSMFGLRLFVEEDTLGALDLYSWRAHSFDDEARLLARVFASHASVAMKAAISERGLRAALRTRDVIGQAKGVLMERERLSGRQAFDRLRQLSNHHNIKLVELAQDIVETGELPSERR